MPVRPLLPGELLLRQAGQTKCASCIHPRKCSRQGQTSSDKLADRLYKQAGLWLPGHRLRTDYSDGDPDIESDFTILKKTRCAAVLTENGFQDCEESLQFLESNEGKEAIIGLHVDGILDYVDPDRPYGRKDLKRYLIY